MSGRPDRHPGLIPRLLRSLRFLRHLRGWQRLAHAASGRKGRFAVSHDGLSYAGDLAGYIDRCFYLFGGYQVGEIQAFLAICPRRGIALDVGANSGTHSVFFARAFERVLAFEPNEDLWPAFERNMQLNGIGNVRLHRIGLADADARLDLHRANRGNSGIGTFVATFEGKPARIAKPQVEVKAFDRLCPELPIDAVKIDVEGFEPNVLAGMRGMLARSRPVVWVEIGPITAEALRRRGALEALFPYPVSLMRFRNERKLLRRKTVLAPFAAEELVPGDYVVLPAGEAGPPSQVSGSP